MRLDVGFVVLVQEGFYWLAINKGHVLADGVNGFHVVFHRHDTLGLLNPQNLNHLAVQEGHVIHVGRRGAELQGRLILHNPLRHRTGVGVGDRDNINTVIKVGCNGVFL